MNRICYKVVYSENYDGTYCSFMAAELPSEYSLLYRLGKTTVPKIGRIFVFDTLPNALEFRYASCSSILEGLATDVGKPTYLCNALSSRSLLINFWKYRNKSNTWEIKEAPKGTLSCSSFTPNKIVDERT